LDTREVVDTWHTPLVSLVEPKATRELADKCSHALDGEFHQGEHKVIQDVRTEDRERS
jgi:hypothetical protein